jgi:hypothetical protein
VGTSPLLKQAAFTRIPVGPPWKAMSAWLALVKLCVIFGLASTTHNLSYTPSDEFNFSQLQLQQRPQPRPGVIPHITSQTKGRCFGRQARVAGKWPPMGQSTLAKRPCSTLCSRLARKVTRHCLATKVACFSFGTIHGKCRPNRCLKDGSSRPSWLHLRFPLPAR